MKTEFRRYLSLLMVLVMCCSFISADAFAESKSRKLGASPNGTVIDSGQCGDNARWTFYEDGTLRISGTGDMENYEWDKELPGVTYPWAEYRGKIVSVVVEDGITGIGDYAFGDCGELTEATIPDGVTRIGDYAFGDCNELTDLILPDSVTHIGKNAFMECESLAHIAVYAGIESIEDGAFSECRSLMEVEYFGTEEQWDEISFGQNVWDEVPGSVYFMDEDGEEPSEPTPEKVAGGQCGENVQWELLEDGTLYIRGSGRMETYSWDYGAKKVTQPWESYSDQIRSVVIEDGITTIGGYAFALCYFLENVTIPDSVTFIGSYAFDVCLSLESITIPDSVTLIGDFAFSRCQCLTSVTIPDSVKTIRGCAFMQCAELRSVSIPDSVKVIAYGAFDRTPWLADQKDEFVILGDNVLLKYNGTAPDVKIPNGVKYISNAFTSCWTSLSTTSVTGFSFDSCTSLVNVTIPGSVTEIGEHAFSRCINLESVTIPEGVEKIDYNAFWSCEGLRSVAIPASVAEIGNRAFDRCGNLTDIRYASSKEQWEKIETGKDIWEGVPGTVTYEAETETVEFPAKSAIDSSEIKFAEAEQTPAEKYLHAGELFENKEYDSAYSVFKELGDYEDSEEKAKESKYLYALDCLEREDYQNALSAFKAVKDYKDSANRIPGTKYNYAGKLAEKSNWKAAADLYKELGSYKDSANKYKNARYEYGLSLLDMKNYNQAIEVFTEIKGYKDSYSKIKEVKYTYILNHKYKTDMTTYEYLKELKSSGYKDCRNIYNDLYAWKVSIVINDSETDTICSDNFLSKYSTIFCHLVLSGGPPGEMTELKAVGYWPSGSSTTVRWGSNDKWGDGYYGYAYYYYELPQNSPAGNFTVKVYAGTELIGQGSVVLTN